MNKKINNKINRRQIVVMLFSAAIVFVVGLSTAQAQRRFEPKSVGAETEVRNVANFTQELLTFLKQTEDADNNANVSEVELKRLQNQGKRIKDGTSNTRSSLQGIISKLKSANRWNDEFDADFLEAITNTRVKAFIKRAGGARKVLTDAETALNSLGQDIDAALNDAKKTRAANHSGEVFFVKASFAEDAPPSFSSRKVRLKCVLLGAGIALAEIGRLKLTAENLDNIFDSNKCGGAAPTT